jgi:quinoprotein dehydrogenase-associated probable ABC transporter substrate-binding protein
MNAHAGKFLAVWLAVGGLAIGPCAHAASGTLTVCADPGNMPLSSRNGEGLENKLAPVIAEGMGQTVQFQWWPTIGHGMMRKTLGDSLCDVWLDMPPETEGALTTVPLYRSTFVLVTRSDRHLRIKDLDDPLLEKLRLGVYETSSIRAALAEHGHNGNNLSIHYVTYNTVADPTEQPSYQVQQVIDGTLDAAAVWGPLAGYYKTIKHAPIELQPLNLMDDRIPLQEDLALAVAKGRADLKAQLEQAMRKQKDKIRQVLVDYGVPLVQCPECIISGDLPAHGPYAPLAPPPTTAAAAPQKTEGVSLDQLKQWLAQGAKPNDELQNAILAQDLSRVDYLLAHGADPNASDNAGYTALTNAARFGFAKVAADLIDHHADVNRADRSGWTPLMYAAWNDDAELVRMLAAKGAELETRSPDGLTPLAIAAQNAKSKALAALIAAGAKVNGAFGQGGYTPLMLATASGSVENVRLLLEHGAQVNARNAGGVTALMIAAAGNQGDLVQLLLDRGADPQAQSQDGRTALSIAQTNNNTEAVKLLESSVRKTGKSL